MLKLRHPLSLLFICLAVMAGVLRSFSAPAPVEGRAPDGVFSALRAEAILAELMAENRPHVVGSPENAVVRDRILARLETYGYEPEVQSRFQCNPRFGSCAPVENIIAHRRGEDGQHAVLVTAHYDSVFAGPGVADDGAGVAAILEMARMAAAQPPFMNDVIFLFSDGEEYGLLGARAFADHHPLFGRVKAVINLEARGVAGPSVMFETGEGNRSIMRMFSKNVARPVANSLVYELYKTMPNDTDYSVYKSAGVMGLNFAFVRGVALYHSELDDLDHLDLGSLQHHGDNAWAMLNALAYRNLGRIAAREDAGYIDLFSRWLIHYPVAIASGLALVLGVWVMLAIAAAFRREFRYRQLRWGLLGVPFLVLAVPLAGYLLAWPLGHWPDLHPLAHPYPWVGRFALVLAAGMVLYTTIKLFSGRVSACAWMILAWLLVFIGAMKLAADTPAVVHIAVVPLAAFALGSLVDLLRRRSPAPLLVASLAGFAATAFVSWNHFFLLGEVYNFQGSAAMAAMLTPMLLVAMPMLLAFVSKKDLDWWPLKWMTMLLVGVLAVHFFVPGYSESRPRDMALVYSEAPDDESGYLLLESHHGIVDSGFAKRKLFEERMLDRGGLQPAAHKARAVDALGLPVIGLLVSEAEPVDGHWRRRLQLQPPAGTPYLRLTLPLDSGLLEARVNGELALDSSIEGKHRRDRFSLRLVSPPGGPIDIEFLTRRQEGFPLAAVSWQPLPADLVEPFMADWPEDARPQRYPPRAEKVQEFNIP